MDFDLLKTFMEVNSTRHFGRAAENLYLTQSTVSNRIRMLEENLNSQLFERNTKKVELTKEGELFIKHAEAILLAWNNAKLDLNADLDTSIQLSVGTTAGLWHYVINPRIELITKPDQIFINALSLSKEEVNRYLYNKIIDVAFLYSLPNLDGIKSEFFSNLDLELFIPKKLAESFAIESTPYIHIDWGESFNLFVARKFKNKQNKVFQTDNAQTAQELMTNFGACAYLPKVLSEEDTNLVSINTPLTPAFKRKLYVCYSTENERKPEIKKFIKNLKN